MTGQEREALRHMVIEAVWALSRYHPPTIEDIATYLRKPSPEVRVALLDLKRARIFDDRQRKGNRVWFPWSEPQVAEAPDLEGRGGLEFGRLLMRAERAEKRLAELETAREEPLGPHYHGRSVCTGENCTTHDGLVDMSVADAREDTERPDGESI